MHPESPTAGKICVGLHRKNQRRRDEKAAVEKGLEWNTIKDTKYFLATVKQFTIQGFITSKYYMTEIMPYAMVPGKFKGKVLIKEGEKVNIYG